MKWLTKPQMGAQRRWAQPAPMRCGWS